MTQEFQQQLFADQSDQQVVLYDHQGRYALDTCSSFHGHGLTKTRVLDGGIDSWAQVIDPSLGRYRLELDEPV